MPLALTTVFADLPDPRRETQNALHRLTDIRVLATCAVIAGADGRDQVAEYGRRKEAFVRRFLALPNGIPSHDTLDRVFAGLDPAALADRFGRWGRVRRPGWSTWRSTEERPAVEEGHVHRVPPPGRGVGRRGPVAPRGAVGPGRRARDHRDCRTGRGAGPDRGGGDDRRGRVPEGDGGAGPGPGRGDVACVTGNQKGLRDAVAGVFDRAAAAVAGCDTAEAVGGGHGRAEERYVTVVENPTGLRTGGRMSGRW